MSVKGLPRIKVHSKIYRTVIQSTEHIAKCAECGLVDTGRCCCIKANNPVWSEIHKRFPKVKIWQVRFVEDLDYDGDDIIFDLSKNESFI